MLYNIILLKPCACDAGYCAFNQCNAEFQNQLTYKYSLSAKLFQIRLNKSAGLLLCRIIIILSFAWAFCNLTFIFIKANSLISKVHDKQDQWFSITQLQLPSGLIYYRSFLYFLCLSKSVFISMNSEHFTECVYLLIRNIGCNKLFVCWLLLYTVRSLTHIINPTSLMLILEL